MQLGSRTSKVVEALSGVENNQTSGTKTAGQVEELGLVTYKLKTYRPIRLKAIVDVEAPSGLVMVNHEQTFGNRGQIQPSAAYRSWRDHAACG